MTGIFIEILNMGIAAGWLVPAVLLLRLILRRAPRWILPVLWGLVGIRLILPVTVESVLSLIPSAQTIDPGILYTPEPTIRSGVYALNSVVNPVIRETFAPGPGDSVNPLQVWMPVLGAVWIAGMCVMLGYMVWSTVRLFHRMSSAVRLRDNIYRSEWADSPFVLGFFRPRICLPWGLTEEEMGHVIAHEEAHIRRRDHWIKPIGFLLLTVYWFHPLLWLAYILLCRDIELACDERVVRELDPAQRAAYSQTLLNCSVSRRSIAACPVAFGEVGVKTRVKNVLHYKKPAFWMILLGILICLTATVCFLTDPVTDTAGQTLTREDVIRLAAKGDELTWADFEDYEYIETGSGLYIRAYEIDEMFSLHIGGGYRDETPMYFYLTAANEFESRIDIRYQDPAVFFAQYENDPIVLEYSFAYRCVPVGYSSEQYTRMLTMTEKGSMDNALLSSVRTLPVVRIDSTEELTAFTETMADCMDFSAAYEDTSAFRDIAVDWDADFFRDNALYLLYISAPDTAERYEMEYISRMGTALRFGVRTADYPDGDDALEGWILAVQVADEGLDGITDTDARVVSSYDPTYTSGRITHVYALRDVGDDEIERLNRPSVTLTDRGEFTFFFSLISSYYGYGTYEMTEDRLILRTYDGKFVYAFDIMEDGTLAFDGDASSDMVWFSDLQDGDVFIGGAAEEVPDEILEKSTFIYSVPEQTET